MVLDASKASGGRYREKIMIKRFSWLLSLAALGLLLAAAPAAARGGGHGGGGHWHGGGGHWHGGGWGWRGGGWGWGNPYYSSYYYADPYYCGSRLVKFRRHGVWVWRRVPVRCVY
jgi:hypothetical protein